MRKFWKGLLAGGAAGVAALAAVNAAIARGTNETEEPAAGGEALTFDSAEGQVFYRAAGEPNAPPLILIHQIGAGASSFTWRRNCGPLARDFCVYAPDLLGFGLSAKPADAAYSAALYVSLISDFLRDVARRPAHLVAHSSSAPLAALVADEYPHLVRSLTLVAPRGVVSGSARADLPGAAFYGLLHSPVLGASFYNAMTSERSLRDYALKELYYDPSHATDRLVAHYYAASHREGAQYAMAAHLSGFLSADARTAFARLAQPLTIVWGRQDRNFQQADALAALNSRAQQEVFDRCRMMPQEEHAAGFNALLQATHSARSAAA
ncbi:MAG: alpha/beta fold hydrolase [Pyrinomonadaceae bacterium]